MTVKSLHVLLINADERTGQLFTEALVEAEFAHQVTKVSQTDLNLQQLNYDQIDVIVLSHHRSDIDSLTLLQEIQAKNENIPLIFMAKVGDEPLVSRALQLGAHSYLLRDNQDAYLNLLPAIIQAAYKNHFRPDEHLKSLTSPRDLDLILHNIVDQTVRFFDGEAGGIYLYRPENKIIEWVAGVGQRREEALGLTLNKNEGFAGVVWAKGQPLFVEDYQKWSGRTPKWPYPKALAGVPIQWAGEFLGVLDIRLADSQASFGDKDFALLSQFAARAAVAIQKAQLHQATTASLAQLTRLYELSTEFVSTLSLHKVASLVIEKAVQATKAHSAVLNLIDSAGKLQLAIGANDEPPPRPDGTTMAIFKSGQALVFKSQDHTPENLPAHLTKMGIKSSIGLPLRIGEQIIGVLFVRHDRPHHFSQQETEILFIFANQAAIAIQNARFYEQAQQEIQERKRAEAALNQYRHRLEELVQQRTAQLEQAMTEITQAKDKIQAILHSVADGLIVTDINHRVILANPAAETLLEHRLETMNNNQRDTAIKNDWLRQLVYSTLTYRIAVAEVDVKLAHSPEGQAKIMHARAALVNDYQGNPVGTVTIIRDVTRLREVDRLKTEFLSIAAHELRTPLTTVLGFSEILLSRELDQPRRQRYLTLINEQAVQLTEIVNSLLDISRLEAGKGLEFNLQPVDMSQLLRAVTQPFSEATSTHHFQLEGLDSLPLVQGDKFRLGQVTKNLISNAIKYSPQGGQIIIRGVLKSNHIEFSIRDEGIGMTLEQQKHLFEKFYRADTSNTAVGGTGLGLAISKLIIDLHQGAMWVNSQREVGTTVYFTLPLANTRPVNPA